MRKLLTGALLWLGIVATASATTFIRAENSARLDAGQRVLPDTVVNITKNGLVTATLKMQTDGNLVLYKTNSSGLIAKHWDSRTFNNPGAYLEMQADGNLVIYSAGRQPLWDSGTSGVRGQAYASFQWDGNLVVRSTVALWDSHSAQPAGTWNLVGPVQVTTLNQGGPAIFSGNQKFALVLQSDGNLVLYANYGSGSSQRALWATGYRGARAVMQADANFVLYTASGSPAWDSGTANKGINPSLVLQDDGNLVIYGDGAVWDIYANKSLLYKICDSGICKYKYTYNY